MQTARVLLMLGIWIAILPYLGFPFVIKNILFLVTGVSLIYVSLLVYKRAMRTQRKKIKSVDTFSENSPTK